MALVKNFNQSQNRPSPDTIASGHPDQMFTRPSYFGFIAPPNFQLQPTRGAFQSAPPARGVVTSTLPNRSGDTTTPPSRGVATPDELYRVYSLGQRRERTVSFINRLKTIAPQATRVAPFVSPFEILPETITEVVPVLYINSAGNILEALKGIQADYPDKQIQVYFDPELTHSAINVGIQMAGIPIHSSAQGIKMKLQEVIDHYHYGAKLVWKVDSRSKSTPLPRPIVLDVNYNPFIKRTRSESPRSMSPKAQEFQPKSLAASV